MRRIEAFGPYDLLERISVGSTGEVFRAVARRDRRVVALKRLMPSVCSDADAMDMLASEARLAQSLDHPAIAKVVAFGSVVDRHFIAYEFVEGRDLGVLQARALASPEGALPLSIALFIVRALCEGLSHAHTRRDAQRQPLGLVHRDVNPSNILISFDGAVVLSDFGIARARGRSLGTGAGEVRGTLSYLSPEQIAGDELDGRTDLYSLGVCLYELAVGGRLFDGAPIEVMQRIQRGEVPSPRARNERVSLALETILFKALAKPAKLRYADADQFLGDLSELVRAEGHDTDSNYVARYVRTLFPEAAAERAAHREESLNMADEKGGSDLDVFEGLAKRPARPTMPGLTPPPSIPQRQRTMMGLPAPTLPGSPGMPPKPLPPPAISPPAAAAPPAPGAAALPPVSAPMPRSAGSITPLPPPARPSLGTLPPAVMPPPPAAPSLGTALGFDEEKVSRAKPAVDMDWDDEEESTHVYDKLTDVLPTAGPRPAAGTPAPNAKVAAAASLLARSGGAASAAPAGKSLPPPPVVAVPPPPAVPASLAVPPRRDEPTQVRPRVSTPAEAPNNRLGIILGGLALAGVVVGAVVFLMPRTGELKIDVRTRDGGSVDKAEIFVDGQKKCETTPCVVSGLSAGPKTVKVLVPGADSAESIETVEAGGQRAVLITLKSDVKGASEPIASTGGATGFKIASAQSDVRVLVDGVDKGSLPIELKDLKAGSHKLKLTAGERYEPIERTIDLTTGEVKDFGTMNLKVLKGQLSLTLDTEGAAVTLVREESGRKIVRAIEEAKWKTPPVRIDGLLAAENWRVVATKTGFEDYTQAVVFEDGQAEKALKIALTQKGKDVVAATATPVGTPVAPVGTPPGKPPPEKAPPVAASGKGTLNINSIPVSKVVLDGRPLGSTPKVGVSVPAGSHTVTFIHPEKGRKSVSVNVKPGETKTAAVRF